ncbi:MAG: potassium transporter TrkA [Thermoleophilia bacterium]
MRPSVRERLRYRFDTTMSRGAIALVAYLAAAAAVLVVIGAALYALFAGGDESFVEHMWEALGRAFDPGTFTGDTGWGFRIISLLVTLGGLFLVSALIGLIATALDQRLEELRKGRSRVIEHGHTLILGWSPSLPLVLSELCEANANQRDAAVVVLSRRDKVEMEDVLRDRIPEGNPTRLVCRTGDPADPADLAMVDPLAARAVIVLCDPDAGGDAQTVKAVLALMSIDPDLSRLSVVAELSDARHAEALAAVTGDRLRTIIGTDLIARVTAEVCFQSGLAAVVQELLDFDGDEIYFREEPGLTGKSFLDAQLAYRDATVMGIRDASGGIHLNPDPGRPLADGDRLIAIAEDDDRFTLAPVAVERDGRPLPPPLEPEVLRALVLGWNQLGPAILTELDPLVAPGSHVRVVADPELVDDAHWPDSDGLVNIGVTVTPGDTADRSLIADAVSAPGLDRVILLPHRSGIEAEEADARTLLSLVLVRRSLDSPGNPNANATVLAELMDVRAVRLARVANPDDFLVSERLVGLAIAQVAENGDLSPVFDELFGAEGADLALVPARRYLPDGGTFTDAIVAGASAGECVIGVRSARVPGEPPTAPRLNPGKGTAIAPGDELVLVR